MVCDVKYTKGHYVEEGGDQFILSSGLLRNAQAGMQFDLPWEHAMPSGMGYLKR